MGLRLSEALAVEVGDIDAHTMQVHIRKGKGGKDRFVPLPMATLLTLRNFWRVHRHPRLLFPNRKKTHTEAHLATSHLNKGGVQKAMREVVNECGFKKTSHITVCAIAMQPTYSNQALI
jgi:integrase